VSTGITAYLKNGGTLAILPLAAPEGPPLTGESSI